jgi:predicted ATPase
VTYAHKISFEESLGFEQIYVETYAKFVYECIKIPPAPIAKRVENILRLI